MTSQRQVGDADSVTLRQRGSVVLGGVFMACCLALFALVARDGGLGLGVAGLLGLGVAVGWCFQVRPHVRLDAAGVHVNNPLRRTTIPWPLVTDCTTRWNLRVYAGERGFAAWAIPARIDRPRASGLLAPSRLARRTAHESGTTTAAASGVSAASAADLIERQRTIRQRPDVGDAGDAMVVRRRWDVVDLACLVVPLTVSVVGVLT